MTTTFRLPDLGEGLTESEIVEWKVAEGDAVDLNDVIAEVETVKAVVELPSPYAGVVMRLHAQEGETVEVGAPIAEFDVGDGDGSEPEAGAPDGDEAAPSDADEVVAPDADDTAAPGERETAAGEQPTKTEEGSGGSGDRVSVLVGSVKLDGGDKPTRRPRTFEQEPFVRESTPDPGAGATRASRRERVSGLRRRTAEAMASSAFTAPHAACFQQVDVTETLRLVADLADRAGQHERPSFLAMASRAIIIAAGRTPGVNATFHAEAGEIEFHTRVNLGIAVATQRGLVVASVDDADLLDASALTGEISGRARAARDGSIGPEALTSSTLTVSNVGVFGIDGGIPILNPGESAIVAIGAVRRIPWEHDGDIALRDVCTITVSFDHRVVDGREASVFLGDVRDMLERPGMALAQG